MGKDKKRKHSRSSSRERKKGGARNDAEMQKMKLQLDNLTKLIENFISQRREDHRTDEDTERANKENVCPRDREYNREVEGPDPSPHTGSPTLASETEARANSQKESRDQFLMDEEILNLLGDDPNAVQGEGIKLHPEIKSRWGAWMKEGLSEENRKNLTKKYPRKGELYAEPPKVNLEVSAAMTDIAKKRDEHFAQTQECVGTAIVSLGAAVSLVIDESGDEVDQLKLIELYVNFSSYHSQWKYDFFCAEDDFS